MSSNLCLDARDRNAMHGDKNRELISCSGELPKEEASLEFTFPEPRTTASHSSDARYVVGLSTECLFEIEGETTARVLRRQDLEDLCQTVTLSPIKSAKNAGSVLILRHEELKQNGELFKHVLYEHSVAASLNAISSRDVEILNRFFHVVTNLVTLSTFFLTYYSPRSRAAKSVTHL